MIPARYHYAPLLHKYAVITGAQNRINTRLCLERTKSDDYVSRRCVKLVLINARRVSTSRTRRAAGKRADVDEKRPLDLSRGGFSRTDPTSGRRE